MILLLHPVQNEGPWLEGSSGGSGHRHCLFFLGVFSVHVEIPLSGDPVVMNLGIQGANKTETALSIREDPNHPGASFDLLVQPLQQFRAFERAMMGFRERQKGEGFSDRLLHPFDKSGVGLLPAIDPL